MKKFLFCLSLLAFIPAIGYPHYCPVEINWETCSLEPDANDGLAECAAVEMPLFHTHPDGRTISIAVKRLRATAPSRGQLWFIAGDPGDSGVAFFSRVATFAQVLDDIDIYTLDHRGVGGSGLLTCPEQESENSDGGRRITNIEIDDCVAHLMANRADELDALTTSENARDLAALIHATREPGQKVWVWGVSYGTYAVNRYLQLFPQQPDGIIVDGLRPADFSYSELDARVDESGRQLLGLCGKDPICSQYLGPDPEATAEALFQKLENGHCSQLGITADKFRLVLGDMMQNGSPIMDYIPPVIHRLNRCDELDQQALNYFFERVVVFGSGTALVQPEPESVALALFLHVSLSEMWDEQAPTIEELQMAEATYLMSTGATLRFARAVKRWPRYSPGQLDDRFANYDGPMLMLHGGLDHYVSLERLEEMRDTFSAPRQSFAFFPQGQHVVISDPYQSQCAIQLYAAFLRDPQARVDPSCIDQLPPRPFVYDDEMTESLFGTIDPWGGSEVLLR
jgi:pimeloyl-ACP methyl ester carboxylesterase